MNIEKMKQCIKAAYHARQPVMIWGAPGVGKSAGCSQAAAEEGVGFIDLRLPLLEPVDLRGLPSIDKGVAKWSRPDFLPTSGKGILMLDEIVQAVPSMQAAASQLVLDRRIGNYTLPDGWSVVAAGNRLSDRAATNAMPTHIANRFVHLYAEVSLDTWVQWALKAKIDIREIAFLKWRTPLLHAFDAQAKAHAFPSPRSWEFVNKILATKLPHDLLLEMVKGAVGEGAAAEFIGFLRVFETMVDPDTILLNPSSAMLPADPAGRYAVVTALACRATKDNLHKIVTYCNRFTDEAGAPEYSIAAIKAVVARDDKLSTTKAFIEWASKHNFLMV